VVTLARTSSSDAIDWTFHSLTGILTMPNGLHGKAAMLIASELDNRPTVNAMRAQWSGRIMQFGLVAVSQSESLIEYDVDHRRLNATASQATH
jgi:hypothetical protein